jgi:hypothetical protein
MFTPRNTAVVALVVCGVVGVLALEAWLLALCFMF